MCIKLSNALFTQIDLNLDKNCFRQNIDKPELWYNNIIQNRLFFFEKSPKVYEKFLPKNP